MAKHCISTLANKYAWYRMPSIQHMLL